MVQALFTALTLRLRGEFPQARIFTHRAEQGLRDGDFLVGLAKMEDRPMPGGLRQCSAVFSVAYYAGEDREAGIAVAHRLCHLLEILPLEGGGPLRGRPRWKSFEEGVLQIELGCTGCVPPEAAPVMEVMDYAAGK